MTPTKVCFTGLEFNPEAVADRWHRGIIPLGWHRYSFVLSPEASNPVVSLNRWLFNNIEGRWAVWLLRKTNNLSSRLIIAGARDVHLAFENDFDKMTFVMADGKIEAFKESIS